MRNKYILIQLNNLGEFKRTEYKTLRDIQFVLQLDYQTIQRFYRLCKKPNIRGVHSLFKDLSERIKIIDNVHNVEL